MTPMVLCFTATSPAQKAANSPQILRRRYCFTGSRCAGRSGSGATCRRSPRLKPTPILPRAQNRRRSGPGPPSSRSRWKAALPSNRRSRPSPPSTSLGRCRGRRAGAAGGSRPRSSNSGMTDRSACMTASSSAAPARISRGPRRGFTREFEIWSALMPTSATTPRRTVLRSGASRSSGHATVIRFSSAGWRVLTCPRHPFPEDCPWDAGPEDHIQVDLADHADTTRAIAEIRQRLEGGALHALVHNAAISPKAEGGTRLGSIDTDIDTWSHVFRVNFFAPIMMARGLIEELKAAKGSVVNVTSIAGSRVHPFAGAAYATSKAALASLTREMASDFGRVGIRVNSIAPGEIDTSILSPGTEKIVDQQIPLHRLGTPDEVAKIIYVLCTETSSYVKGAEININSGPHV